MQSLESSFFLIALDRFPHALSVCASAIEGSLQASDISAKEKDGFQELVKKAKKRSQAIADFGDDSLNRFRELRNRITHRGFSPLDDSESASLYLEVGLPFLILCYREFHGFDLMDGLLQEYAEHLRAAQRVHTVWKASPEIDQSYCFRSFSHLVRWVFKRNFSSEWEIGALVRSEEVGVKFERTYAERERIEREFRASWALECPICDEYEGAIAELDADSISRKEIRLGRMACTNCGFVVHGRRSDLGQVLLEKQISEARAAILRDFGIE